MDFWQDYFNFFMKISAIILSKNEEKNIERCLNSVKDFSDEILLLDEFSQDNTVEIAKKFGAKIIKNRNSEDFSFARNKGSKNAKNKWVFYIDADEELVGSLPDLEKAEQDDIFAFKIKRKDFLWGREIEHGENGKWNEIRLLNKNSGMWRGKIHEVFVTKKEAAFLKFCFLRHYPHQTVSEFLSEINKYSDIRAKELNNLKVKSTVFDIAFYPLAKFLYDYIFLFGFLDGVHGFVIASLMSFYSFLVRSKLYILRRDFK